MTSNEARQLLGYCSWANAAMFAAAEGLSDAQRDAHLSSSFPSLRNTLAHIVSAEWIWLRRWVGESPEAMPAWVSEASLDELRSRLASVEAERDAFLSTLADGDLERVVSYRSIRGDAFEQELGHLMRHVVNHSTYHRGQAGHPASAAPGTDLTTYLRQVI